jgi:two-component system, LytTR family, sensor kinase
MNTLATPFHPAARFAQAFAGWTLCAALFATQSYFSGTFRGQSVVWSQAFMVWLAWAYAWALLTPSILRLAARFPLERPHLMRALLIHAASSAACVLFNLALFAVAAPVVGASSDAGAWPATFLRLFATTFLPDLAVYWVLVIVAQLRHFALATQERERRELKLETKLAEARLLALKAQIHPHFLFNTLNSIAVLIHEDAQAAHRMLLQLSTLLRKVLESSESQMVALREELALTEAYLQIEQTRFADRLSYRIEAAADVLDARVPSLILQPLVENALRHGIAKQVAPGTIIVTATRQADRLLLTVCDNGPGLPPTVQRGVGLTNTCARLEQLFGTEQDFRLEPAARGGTVASLVIPLQWVTAA